MLPRLKPSPQAQRDRTGPRATPPRVVPSTEPLASTERPLTLYMVSTPLNVWVACAVALAQAEYADATLLFIDQAEGSDTTYLEALVAWRGSPFRQVERLAPRTKGAFSKWKSRRRAFAELDGWIAELRPSCIAVGNDRRAEYQYAMARAHASGLSCEGAYLDDGAWTYLGRSPRWLERQLDHRLKRLAYGSFWETPPSVGASSWVERAYVAEPQHVFPCLREKHLEDVPAAWFWEAALVDLAKDLLRRFGICARETARLDLLITAPHEKVLLAHEELRTHLRELALQGHQVGRKVAVKAHPRSGGDPLRLGGHEGVRRLPAEAGLEAMLPAFPSQTAIVSTGLSTLLTTSWLRPDLRALGVLNDTLTLGTPAAELLAKLGVELRPHDEVLDTLRNPEVQSG